MDLDEIARLAERKYRTDPVFHAQVHVGARVLMEYQRTRYTDQDWRAAKRTVAVMLTATSMTVPPPTPFNTGPLDPQAQHYKEWAEKEDDNES
jgi:hypothetical protein